MAQDTGAGALGVLDVWRADRHWQGAIHAQGSCKVDIEGGSAEANCWCRPSGASQRARALRRTVSAPPHGFSSAGNRQYLSLAVVRVG